LNGASRDALCVAIPIHLAAATSSAAKLLHAAMAVGAVRQLSQEGDTVQSWWTTAVMYGSQWKDFQFIFNDMQGGACKLTICDW
jgi:hypothetical protein